MHADRAVSLATDKNGVDWWVLRTNTRDTELLTEVMDSEAVRRKRGDTNWETSLYRAPASLAPYYQMRSIFPEAVWSPKAKARAKALKDESRRMVKVLKNKHIPKDIPDLIIPDGMELLDYQYAEATRMLLGGSVIAMDMGLGKTPTACVGIATRVVEMGDRDILVLCTVSTLRVWEEHFRTWAPMVQTFIYYGPQRARVFKNFEEHEGPKVLITTHGLIDRHVSLKHYGSIGKQDAKGPPTLERDWDIALIDEGHKMGFSPDGTRQRALATLRGYSKTRYSLTGTPVNDNTRDAWIATRWVSPLIFGEHAKAFLNRYCLSRETMFGEQNLGLHPDMTDEFHKILRPWFSRRTKEEYGATIPDSLPPKLVTLPLSGKQATQYKQMEEYYITSAVNEGSITASGVLDAHRKLSYISSGCLDIRSDGSVAMSKPSNKLDYLAELVEERNGDPFVVYTYSSMEAEFYARELGKTVDARMIIGDTKRDMRDMIISNFQSGEIPVLVVTNAASEGVTLTATDLIVLARPSDHIIDNQQVAGRHDRVGQTRHPQIQILATEGTVDFLRLASLTGKLTKQGEVTCDKRSLSASIRGDYSLESRTLAHIFTAQGEPS